MFSCSVILIHLFSSDMQVFFGAIKKKKKKAYVQFLSLLIPGMQGPFVFDDDFCNWSLTFNLIIVESCV